MHQGIRKNLSQSRLGAGKVYRPAEIVRRRRQGDLANAGSPFHSRLLMLTITSVSATATPRYGLMRELLAELVSSLERQRQLVYCAVVETRGSTPQKAGATMLVYPDGTQAGTLGGGCVEAEVKRRALSVLNEPGACAEVFSFCLDDDYGWDDGLICGGRMTILADPLRLRSESGFSPHSSLPTPHSYYHRYRELVESGRGCTEVVALANNLAQLGAGSRYLFDAAGEAVGQLADSPVPAEVRDQLKPLAKRPGPAVHKGLAYLPVLPRVTLVIVGAGHVGQAVAKLAAEVDFDIWVLDDRDKFASQQRFPQAERRIVGDIGRTLQELAREVHPGMYCLIMTRGHNHDEEALYHLCRTNAGYVGMIGSKRKIKLIYEDLLAKGIPEEVLAKVHSPLGLPIGSQTVPEIAISIVAELIRCRNLGSSEFRVPSSERKPNSELGTRNSEL
jgi:xanthine dehydrogenase accessory factor